MAKKKAKKKAKAKDKKKVTKKKPIAAVPDPQPPEPVEESNAEL